MKELPEMKPTTTAPNYPIIIIIMDNNNNKEGIILLILATK